MFCKRDDGLGPALLPFELGGLILAVLCTVLCGVKGFWAILAFLGFWLAGFIVLALLFYIFSLIVSLTVDQNKPVPEDDHPFIRFMVNTIISHICRVMRIRIHTEGMEKLPEGRYLIVSNHRSSFDPITTVWALRKNPVAIITKPENHRIIIAGPMIYGANFLSINREDPREALKTIQAATALLQNDVVSVGVYPEGTRNRAPEEGLLPFHNGVFKIASRAKVPLVVATTVGADHISKNFPWHHTDVYIRLLETIPPEELQGPTSEIGRRVQEIIENGLREQGN